MWFYAILLLSFLVGSQCAGNGTDCLSKEKSLGVLDFAKDAVEKVKDLLPNCSADHPSANSSECGAKEKALAFLEIATDLISEARKNYPTCPDPVIIPAVKPIDCNDVLQLGNNASGVYRVWPSSSMLKDTSILVYCDMDTDGGGWTVIQRRGSTYQQQDFYQDWETYKRGFGDIQGEFWLGNDNIHALSKQASYKVRIDLEDFKGNKKFAVYDSFWIENEAALYKLHVTKYSGTAGNSLDYKTGMVFCTKDRTNGKTYSGRACAETRRTGWWFDSCTKANINGVPRSGGDRDDRTNLYWLHWKSYESLASANMKLRRS